MSSHMQNDCMSDVTLYKMLTGRPMTVLKWRGPNEVPRFEQLSLELKQYMQQLTVLQEIFHVQETRWEPILDNEEGSIKTGIGYTCGASEDAGMCRGEKDLSS
ncbi:hypothetical protein chiPu_0020327 [Chiloscyllium punctatum]|uniref:Uncharacterized protein n=1 Tax=Chiloscyllium punctatum TaxID=137246 RepID=A0A401REL1_CHIPU|nr:hypothetical protein [Chiloscyllium punctatum]